MIIDVTIKNKQAFLPVPAEIVCGNKDYKINFSFDEEWENRNVKTARFFYNGSYEEVVFTGNICEVPVLSNATGVYIGVFSGDVYTTTPAYVPCVKSILCLGGTHAEPPKDVYNEIIELINNLQIEKGKPTDELPLMDGEASAGSNMEYARADHVHPTDTTRASAKDLAETNEKLKEVEGIAKGAHRAYHYGDLATMITALNDLPNTTYMVDNHINIIDTDVPDFWVVAVAENSIPYTYTDDTALVNDIMTNGTIRVGYYVLARLETGKVIFTDYVQKTDYATSTKAGLMYPVSKCLLVTGDGGLHLVGADQKLIDAKASTFHPLTPSMLDYIIKYGITTNTETLTDEEKSSASDWLGYVKTDTAVKKLYGTDHNGNQTTVSYHNGILANGIVQRNPDGSIQVADITNKSNDIHAVNYGSMKNYVGNLPDNLVLDITSQTKWTKWLGLPYMSNEVEAEYSWANTSYTINNPYNIFSGFSGVTSTNVGLATTDILSLDDIGACEIFGGNTSYGYLSEASIIALIGAYYLQTNDGAVVLVVTNRFKFNNAYNETLPSNGTYLCHMTYDRQSEDTTMYSYSITVSKLRKYQLTKCDNKLLDLENNAVIKALLARIEALEAK